MDEEKWKSLAFMGFPSYEISNLGNARNIVTNRNIKAHATKNGPTIYFKAINDKQANRRLDRVLAEAFLDPPPTPSHSIIRHIDGNRSNNDLDNLRWGTVSERARNRKKPKRFGRPVLQYTKEGEFIKRWNCIKEVIEANPGYCLENISACCRTSKEDRCVAYNSRWKLERLELENEEWQKLCLPSLSEIYVSSKGRVKHRADGVANYGTLNTGGYRCISLKDSVINIHKHKQVHVLVAIAFLGPQEAGKQVNHKNGNKEDNDVENLEWVTASENIIHAIKTGLTPLHNRGVLKIERNTGEILTSYHSVTDAATANKTHKSSILSKCKRKMGKGLMYVYADNPLYTEKLATFLNE